MSDKAKRKKEDKKYLIIMLLLTVASGGIGYLIGMLMGKLKKSGYDIIPDGEKFNMIMSWVAPGIMVFLSVVLLIVALVFIKKSKNLMKNWDGEDEEVADRIETFVGVPLVMTSILMVIVFFLLAVGLHYDMSSEVSDKMEDIVSWLNIGSYIVSMVIMTVVQKLCIDVTKDMNPEKKGSVFDAKFSDKWMDSCDEAQRLQIYKAGSKGYKAMSSMCMTLWVVCIVADLFFEQGILPVTMVTVIWLTGVISYNVAAIKEENKMRDR